MRSKDFYADVTDESPRTWTPGATWRCFAEGAPVVLQRLRRCSYHSADAIVPGASR